MNKYKFRGIANSEGQQIIIFFKIQVVAEKFELMRCDPAKSFIKNLFYFSIIIVSSLFIFKAISTSNVGHGFCTVFNVVRSSH